MGERRAVLHRCLHVDDRLERLVGDLDEFGCVDRLRAGVGDHDRDAVTLVVRVADGEREVLRALHVLRDRPGARHRGLPVVPQIGAGEDGDNPFGGSRGRGVDRPDLRVGVRAPDDGHRQAARDENVVDERPLTPEQWVVLLALDRGIRCDASRWRS